MKKVILTKSAPAPIGPYSQAIQVGNFVFCSGQVSIDPKTGNFEAKDVRGQAELVMKNIAEVLKAADVGFANVVKTTIFLKSMADFTTVNEVYGSYFKEPYPARSTVEVGGLPKGALVEIEVLAVTG